MDIESIAHDVLQFTELEIYNFVKAWYHKLDVHAPIEELFPFVAQDGLKMVFPEMTAEGLAGLSAWYERVIHLFFDELHTVKQIHAVPKGDRTEVKIMVQWEASRWTPPAPYSGRIILNAYQTWEIVRSPITHKPIILTYTVDSLNYHDGSAKL